MKPLLRGSLAALIGCATFALSGVAFAAGEICFNDDDCPGGGQVCGGDVCNWNKQNPAGTTEKPYTCNPAGTDAKTMDGWCTDDSDCKCKAEGAKCGGIHCTFTKASDAPAGTGGSGTAGSTSTAGTTASGGSGTAGSTSTAGTTASGGSGSTPAPAADDGGCSISVPANRTSGALLALGVAGLGLALARRRR